MTSLKFRVAMCLLSWFCLVCVVGSIGDWTMLLWALAANIFAGLGIVGFITQGTIPRKRLRERKVELLLQPTPPWKPDIAECARWAKQINPPGALEYLPGETNGAITRYLIGEIDAYRMEELLDIRINDALVREKYNIPKGMSHNKPQEFPPTRETRKEK